MAGSQLIHQDLPQADNRVDLDPKVKDFLGLPAARITYSPHQHEKAAAIYLGARLQAMHQLAPGAVAAAIVPYPLMNDGITYTAHLAGTARMGRDPRTSVCAPSGRLARGGQRVRRRRVDVPDVPGLQPDPDDHGQRPADRPRPGERQGGLTDVHDVHATPTRPHPARPATGARGSRAPLGARRAPGRVLRRAGRTRRRAPSRGSRACWCSPGRQASATRRSRSASRPSSSSASEHGFEVVATEERGAFTRRNLRHVQRRAVPEHHRQRPAAEGPYGAPRLPAVGGGWAGVHSAADTEYDWPFYTRILAGSRFLCHPVQQPGVVVREAPRHISTRHLEERWQVPFEEFYSFTRAPRDSAKVLLTIDESTYQQDPNTSQLPTQDGEIPEGTTGVMGYHPMSWQHRLG